MIWCTILRPRIYKVSNPMFLPPLDISSTPIEVVGTQRLSQADVDLLRIKLRLLPLVLRRHVIRATLQDGQLTLVFSESLLRR